MGSFRTCPGSRVCNCSGSVLELRPQRPSPPFPVAGLNCPAPFSVTADPSVHLLLGTTGEGVKPLVPPNLLFPRPPVCCLLLPLPIHPVQNQRCGSRPWIYLTCICLLLPPPLPTPNHSPLSKWTSSIRLCPGPPSQVSQAPHVFPEAARGRRRAPELIHLASLLPTLRDSHLIRGRSKLSVGTPGVLMLHHPCYTGPCQEGGVSLDRPSTAAPCLCDSKTSWTFHLGGKGASQSPLPHLISSASPHGTEKLHGSEALVLFLSRGPGRVG